MVEVGDDFWSVHMSHGYRWVTSQAHTHVIIKPRVCVCAPSSLDWPHATVLFSLLKNTLSQTEPKLSFERAFWFWLKGDTLVESWGQIRLLLGNTLHNDAPQRASEERRVWVAVLDGGLVH